MHSPWIQQAPAPTLRPFVRHYWLSLNNAQPHHEVVPDGCTDLVLEVHGNEWQAWVHGSVTRPTVLPCVPGTHYLGIRFQPGQGRHFMQAGDGELTGQRKAAPPLLCFPVEPIAQGIATAGVFADIDCRLMALLAGRPPRLGPADLLVRRIQRARGAVRLDELAAGLGKSPRHLQRLFLETVGVTAKFLTLVTRADEALRLIASGSGTGLAEVAAQTGYADQSHMTRDLERLTGRSPGRWQVAFVQDGPPSGIEYWQLP